MFRRKVQPEPKHPAGVIVATYGFNKREQPPETQYSVRVGIPGQAQDTEVYEGTSEWMARLAAAHAKVIIQSLQASACLLLREGAKLDAFLYLEGKLVD